MPARILIVEDEPVVLKFSATVLKNAGYEVLVAGSVAEARRIMAAQPPETELRLIVDVVLGGESGVAFVEQELERDPGLVVLLTSGFTDEVLTTHPRCAERVRFLRKPFTGENLLGAVGAICSRS